MYRNFFSLSELPFSISPNPKYLFMSERHKEALTHLTYGLGDVGGFALLTGEVGTGKTTISRRLMEQLPDNTQAAFILNPMLSSQELLATLCDELKIRYRKTGASLKTLTDKIAEKLKKNNENNLNTLLIIDEAQHLQPEVLEQLRLLTNLETNTKKLLQVILIGQPELQQLLQRRDLRQLAQRITARYHLLPLTPVEQVQYIQHRLLVADCTRALFDKGALKKIHQLSQGVPRLTNLLCHSALMQAYNQNDSVVNKKIVSLAAESALGNEVYPTTKRSDVNQTLVVLLVLTIISCIGLMGFWWGQHQTFDEINTVEPTSITPSLPTQLPKSGPVTLAPVVKNLDLSKSDFKKQEQLTNVNTIDDNVTSSNSSQLSPVLSRVDSKDTVKNEMTKVIAGKPRNSVNEMVITNSKNNKTHKTFDVSSNQQSNSGIITKSEDYTLTQVEGTSSDLLARFQMAIDETQPKKNKPSSEVTKNGMSENVTDDNSITGNANHTDYSQVKQLSQMSQTLQNIIPILQFEQHIYASDGQGWVNVNGRDRYEGDYIADDLKLNKILPQRVILSYQGQTFSLSALTNWQ
jgi:type II secretory pathway predicted ATPase ExeA